MTIDPETLMAFADGELGPIEAKRVERAVAEDPALQRQVAAHRALRGDLAAHFGPIADEPVPDRLAALLETDVVELPRRRSFGAVHWGAMAATLVLGLLIGGSLTGGGDVTGANGVLIARGGLERTLDTQLASAQPARTATRIGLSFRDRRGALCRTFESPALGGIACRANDEWRLVRTVSGTGGATEYRQASSAETLEAAAAMMAGDPLDAAGEAAAKARGWR